MKNKKAIYGILMALSLAGLGVGFYFLTKKKGVVMQAASPDGEVNELLDRGEEKDLLDIGPVKEIIHHPIPEKIPVKKILKKPIGVKPVYPVYPVSHKHEPFDKYERGGDLYGDSRVYQKQVFMQE